MIRRGPPIDARVVAFSMPSGHVRLRKAVLIKRASLSASAVAMVRAW